MALHDIGEVTPAFQAKVPAHWSWQALGPLPDAVVDTRHDVDGLTLLDPRFAAVVAPDDALDTVAVPQARMDAAAAWGVAPKTDCLIWKRCAGGASRQPLIAVPPQGRSYGWENGTVSRHIASLI
ncbi:hypothetical protein AA15237_0058 [Komagataeibacter xylinus NBRC 15237]|nr:hypothetical protein AA15237_0058 [Komagataeibacter xylinus NBRC 15237]